MRKQVHFVENNKIGKLLSRFRISQGPLYHYTDSNASINILNKKQIYLTRADHFLDNREIRYGINLLTEESKKVLTENESKHLQIILDALSERFRRCFIFCFTQILNSTKHIEIHGNNILEFTENFPAELANMSWHSMPNGSGYSLYYSTDLYKTIEGYVEYDLFTQMSIANEICQVFKETRNTDVHIVDQFHFIDVIMKFIILCKEPCYGWEKEYRMGLVSNPSWESIFENIRDNGKVFIKLITPTEIKKIE